jgi:hypothetical protein
MRLGPTRNRHHTRTEATWRPRRYTTVLLCYSISNYYLNEDLKNKPLMLCRTTDTHFCTLHGKKIAHRLQLNIHFDSPSSLTPPSPRRTVPLPHATISHAASPPLSHRRPHAAAPPSLAPPPSPRLHHGSASLTPLPCATATASRTSPPPSPAPPLGFPPHVAFWSRLRVLHF